MKLLKNNNVAKTVGKYQQLMQRWLTLKGELNACIELDHIDDTSHFSKYAEHNLGYRHKSPAYNIILACIEELLQLDNIEKYQVSEYVTRSTREKITKIALLRQHGVIDDINRGDADAMVRDFMNESDKYIKHAIKCAHPFLLPFGDSYDPTKLMLEPKLKIQDARHNAIYNLHKILNLSTGNLREYSDFSEFGKWQQFSYFKAKFYQNRRVDIEFTDLDALNKFNELVTKYFK